MLHAGMTYGNYFIERKLGAGAFGAVFRAQRLSTNETVAIKILLNHVSISAGGMDQVSRFKREASNLRRIQSDYVAKILDFLVSEEHGMLLVLEYIEGDLLEEILNQTQLSPVESIELGLHLAQGLYDMHKAGVIHRDVKPANIILRQLPGGLQRATLFDLGLSRFLSPLSEQNEALETMTASQMAIGTPAYMAPEQILDAHKASAPADIYGLGTVLYYAACGHLPFEGDDRDIARKKLNGEAPPLPLGTHDEVSRKLAALIERCIKRLPSQRYSSIEEILADLGELRILVREKHDDATLTFSGRMLQGQGVQAIDLHAKQNAILPAAIYEGAPMMTDPLNVKSNQPTSSKTPLLFLALFLFLLVLATVFLFYKSFL